MCLRPTTPAEGENRVAEAAQLRDRVQDGATPADREAGLNGIVQFVDAVGRPAEPFVVPLLPAVLKALSDKDATVKAAAEKAGESVMSELNKAAIKVVMPSLLEVMEPRVKPQTKMGALRFLSTLAVSATEEVSLCLPEIVPAVTECMTDIKKDLSQLATDTLVKCCGAVGNKDIEPFIPNLVRCIAQPEEVQDCVHKLAATTFVQAVDAKTLSLMVPLLLRGLAERSTPIRRKSCVIIDNMAKLVDSPVDALEFASLLTPHVEKAVKEMSNPEARTMAERAAATLAQVAADASSAGATGQPGSKADAKAMREQLAKVLADVSGAALGADAEASLQYVADMCATLVDVKNFENSAWENCVVPYMGPYITDASATKAADAFLKICFQEVKEKESNVDEEEGEDLCNCEFSLAYGAKVLLMNATLHLKRGQRYGLCGPNGCGKSTLMRAIANGQVDGFPPKEELRTVYVEHDIDASQAETPVVEFVYSDPTLQDASHPEHGRVEEVLSSVGFSEEMQAAPVASLSGGWKMKLALARAMLMNADILLLDEPTNHLDVHNVQWLVDYLTSLTDVTSVIVSHDSGFLDKVCTGIIHYEGRKIRKYRGNLAELVKHRPEAKSYYNLEDAQTKWVLPEPGFLEGITSKDRAILKMRGVSFGYPGTEKKILNDVTLQVSLNSRVACVGPNGAGKSTMIKLLTGELEPNDGFVWKHPNMRVAYVAQHAFHHIENHLDKTPNQYIQWRYATGEDREAQQKVDRLTEEEEAALKAQKVKIEAAGTQVQRKVEKLLGRRKLKKGYEYEVEWQNAPAGQTSWMTRAQLEEMGYEKLVNELDAKEAAAAGLMGRPLTAANVEKMLGELGLESEFATHSHIRGLSGGQKVKLVLGAAMWQQPHIIVLDEPTNYLDRESLGAMASALKEFGGGVVVVSHSQEFLNQVCGETWTVGGGKLEITGQSEAAIAAAKIEWKRQEETTDALGNTIKVKGPKKELSRKEKKQKARANKARKARGEAVSDEEEDDW
jgi:elongation factor 3